MEIGEELSKTISISIFIVFPIYLYIVFCL